MGLKCDDVADHFHIQVRGPLANGELRLQGQFVACFESLSIYMSGPMGGA